MLASTVQFSKYGRSRRPGRRVPRGYAPHRSETPGSRCHQRGRSAGGRSWPRVSSTPVPSGPNSVLGPAAARHGVPSRKRAY
jgi:hypothetical protein